MVKLVDEIGLKKENAIDKPHWRDALNKLSRILR